MQIFGTQQLQLATEIQVELLNFNTTILIVVVSSFFFFFRKTRKYFIFVQNLAQLSASPSLGTFVDTLSSQHFKSNKSNWTGHAKEARQFQSRFPFHKSNKLSPKFCYLEEIFATNKILNNIHFHFHLLSLVSLLILKFCWNINTRKRFLLLYGYNVTIQIISYHEIVFFVYQTRHTFHYSVVRVMIYKIYQ